MPDMIKFGTDGWRAVIAEDFTFANVRACAQGVADYLKGVGKGKGGVVIGYDTRFASEDFATASAFKILTLSVFSQGNLTSVRPKWP